MSEWRLVFWIVAAMLVITNIIYLIFGSAEIEPWNDIRSEYVKPANKDEKKHSQTVAVADEQV